MGKRFEFRCVKCGNKFVTGEWRVKKNKGKRGAKRRMVKNCPNCGTESSRFMKNDMRI